MDPIIPNLQGRGGAYCENGIENKNIKDIHIIDVLRMDNKEFEPDRYLERIGHPEDVRLTSDGLESLCDCSGQAKNIQESCRRAGVILIR